jgi:hypothetical protein
MHHEPAQLPSDPWAVHEADRLKTLIENNTNALEELRLLRDPATTTLIQDLERVRAESIAKLAELRARSTEH